MLYIAALIKLLCCLSQSFIRLLMYLWKLIRTKHVKYTAVAAARNSFKYLLLLLWLIGGKTTDFLILFSLSLFASLSSSILSYYSAFLANSTILILA